MLAYNSNCYSVPSRIALFVCFSIFGLRNFLLFTTCTQDLAMNTANESNCTVILANDPDSDRMALAEKQPR